ncbi:MAG: cell division protein [Sphingobacteriales bacterium]|nr:MAG: cell division protein [Sphingobacteriales bacterium]
MPVIKLETTIIAPVDICFNLSRSIDVHVGSMSESKEKAIAGVTSGLIGLDETVTWKAWHFSIPMKMTVKITSLNFPDSFTDKMIKGPFSKMKHVHQFIAQGPATVMKDIFEYTSPLGMLGKMVDILFLRNYMQRLLERRNDFIKQQAEDAAS